MILKFLCCLFHPTKLIMEKPCNLNRYITRVWPWPAPEQHLVATLWTSFGHLNYPGGSSKLSSRWSPVPVLGCIVMGHQRRPGHESLQPGHNTPAPDSSPVSRAQWSWVIPYIGTVEYMKQRVLNNGISYPSLNLFTMMFSRVQQ